MKWITSLLMSLGLLACKDARKAQSEEKLKSDPTYSTSNYKHPNKASAARGRETKEGLSVKAPSAQDVQRTSYKSQLPGQPPVGGITVPYSSSENLANRNYKMPKPPVSSSQNSALAKKTKKRSESASGE